MSFCVFCGRRLTSKESLLNGYGRSCGEKHLLSVSGGQMVIEDFQHGA
jgi:hypothetical protein